MNRLEPDEAQFQKAVVDYATLRQWKLIYHVPDSRRVQGGFPDWVLVRDGRVLFVELKRQSGRLSPKQKVWLAALEQVRDVIDGIRASARSAGVAYPQPFQVFVWRPSDWPEIRRVLM